MLEDKGQVDGHADFGKGFHQHLGAKILAVHEHAVAIKNDEGNLAQIRSSPVTVAMKNMNV